MGFAQALSHIQDQALATIPKILAIFAVVGFALPWFADRMVDFSKQQFSQPLIAAGAPMMEPESSGAVRSLFENESTAENSYYPQSETPRWNPASTAIKHASVEQASFARESTLQQPVEFKVPLPEVWHPPALDLEKPANPFQLPSHRFSRRPSVNLSLIHI